MKFRLRSQHIFGAAGILILLAITWGTLSGGINQIPNAVTIGQQIETAVQLFCGLMGLLTLITCFQWKHWALRIQQVWTLSLVFTAGLSALVWGPPMPLIALLFSALALLVAMATKWALRRAFWVN